MGRFDLVQPSLIQQLRSILDQYQDDGQILKELIQNAEDAKATEVKFLLDETQHDSRGKYLHHPDMAEYQGAALYAYNNAEFADNDWVGLKMINDSVKKNDAMKVGRFGLGFKSVFHMTDLPSVISGDRLSFIDPHERFFIEEGKKVTGYTWHLKDDYKSMKKISPQFDPYRGLFGCTDSTFKHGRYNSTLFRFPLRNRQSQLSNNLYNSDKVMQVFESFQSIAELVLLFLTSVESIELYRRQQGQAQPELLFKVQISADTLHSVRLRRSDFLSKLGHGRTYTDAKAVFPLTVDTIRYNRLQAQKSSIKYLVSHFCAGTNKMSEDVSSLLSDPSMTYVPWVSAAVVLGGQKVSADNPSGHVFCFLPLPLQRSSMSGLPVHVNGFFAVSSNRHQLKWPSIRHTEGRSGEKVGVTDKSCLWNELLLEEVLPKAMFNLISMAIDLSRQSQSSLDANFVYNLIPSPDAVLDRWKLVLPLFYKLLSQIEFIRSDSNGSWQHYQKVILLSQSDEGDVRQVLLKSLVQAGVNAAVLPAHMISVLNAHISASDMFTTPELLRLLMRKKPTVLRSLSEEEKVLLLGYLLSDGDYEELDDLPLLPLSNGEFTVFDCSGKAELLYIPSDSHPASVLPMISNRFIDISNKIDDEIIKHLKTMAVKECSQLRVFTARIFSTLAMDLITDGTLLCDPYYGDIVWEYISKNFAGVDKFEGLHLVPAMSSSGDQLVLSLSRERPILACCQGVDSKSQFSAILIRTVEKLGVRLVHRVPMYISTSKLLLDKYLYMPNAKGVKDILKAYCDSNLLNDLSCLNQEETISLRILLSKLNVVDISEDDLSFLKGLELFQSKTSDRCLSVRETDIAAPFDSPPLPATCVAIDVRDAASKSLAELLGVRQLTKATLLLEHIIPAMEEGRCSVEETVCTTLSVLHQYKSYMNEDAYTMTRLQSIPCVRREDNSMVTADQCYDPTDSLLSTLLLGEQLHPHSDYCGSQAIEALRLLGLKTAKDVDRDLIMTIARNIEDMSVTPTADRKGVAQKSLSLLNYLNKHTSLVDKDKELRLALENSCWVVPESTPTASIPHSLSWFSSGGCTLAPDSITSHSYATLVSSAMAILPVDVNSKLKALFKWDQRPPLPYIAQQLQTVINSYQAREKGAYMHVLSDIYLALSESPFDEVQQELSAIELENWVWHGDGFTPPNRIIIERTSTSLSPYVYSLPAEMADFTALLVQAGSWMTCTSDVLLAVLELIRDKYLQIELFDKEEVNTDLRLVLDIINHLKPAPGEELSLAVQKRLLVPVLTENECLLSLCSVTECTYCDTDWLRERRSQMDHTEAVTFVHPAISNELAEQLGVLSLVNRMLDTDTFELGEGFGQSEPLTRRLHNLLKEYSDGFAVPKELLQNADDAGATEVKFLYDERTNRDCLNCLIDDGLKDCQGPALWVYNNAVFSDADFEAIIKLSGATKSRQTEKIGGFGLGFNAVYNLTDVPSFVSRNYVVIFDPHTTHLGKSIPDANKPGIKIDLQKNHKALATLKNQFKPYNGVFGADLRHKGHGVTYDGTLFRFPLRSERQARKSEISSLHYNREQMVELLEMMARSCDSLLLFTQNVRRVSVYHLADHHEPHQANLLFSVGKEPVKYLRELRVPVNLPSSVKYLTEDEQEFTRQSSILKAASTILQDQRERRSSRLGSTSRSARRSSTGSKNHLPESSILMKMRYRQSREGCTMLKLKDGAQDRSSHWLVTCSMGDGDAMEVALRHESLAPVGGVAVPLDKKDMVRDLLQAHVMKDTQNGGYSGLVFCYLPLPIKSGLPVHINGAFAVTSNRRHLVEKVTDNKTNQLVEWNHSLMGDSITKSYLLMLEDIKSLVDNSTYDFYLLWPRVAAASASCLPLVNQFYMAISSPLTDQKLFSNRGSWVTLSNTVLLDAEIRSSPIASQAFKLLELVMASSSNLVLDIPDEILTCFNKAGCLEAVTERTLTREMLFQKIVFPNLGIIPEDIRNLMVLHALDSGDKLLGGLIRSHRCVPVTPKGDELSFVQDLINPTSQLAVLYSPADGRFPYGSKNSFLSSQRLAALEMLGMIGTDLPDTELLERAQSIPTLYTTNKKAALSRTCALLQYMDSRLATTPDIYNDIQSQIRAVPFLPMRRRPADSSLEWKGEKHQSDLLSPEQLYPSNQYGLLCYVEPVIDSTQLGVNLSERLSGYLGLSKQVTVDQILQQLRVIQRDTAMAMVCYKLTQRICNDIYQFLQETKLAAEVLASLGKFILIGDNLVAAEHVVLKGARDCAPYLFELPYDLHRFEHVFKQAGMRDKFEVSDYVKAITEVHNKFDGQELNNRELNTLLNMATLLHQLMSKSQQSISDVTSLHGPVYLVNAANRVVDAASLCFNDCSWLPDDQSMEFAHSLIPYQIARGLGVNTKRQEAIKKHSQGIPFGQKEKLTKRLKRIMSSYPCGKEIFKELVQNADDAGATQIHFVRDCRQHSTEKVFEECWKPLQGPALCVYNNRPFSRSDLEGIQNLGEGSKGHDPNRTGQYGVGFNSVYHLTDSPSFITSGPEVGEVLCAFDPHCKFVPGATPDEPGRMFSDLGNMRKVFTDVFNCYLPDQFALDGATMFRFPLRTKEMSMSSKISNAAVNLDTVGELMKKFRQEMFDVLLFVNNLEEISISDMPRARAGLANTYTVKAKVTQRYTKLRKEFSSYVKEISAKLNDKEISLAEVEVKEISYKICLEDSLGYKETWLVVQRIGFEHPHLIPKSVLVAHNSGEINLLPRGGVACLLNREVPKNMKVSDRPKKVFCFLPLPIHTQLPAHINGHFALDHEARRGLWRDDDGGPRTDWNMTLTSQVICPAYRRLLESFKEKSFPSLDGLSSQISMELVDGLLETYHRMFPQPQQDPQWQGLVDSLYRSIAASETRLFPVLNKLSKRMPLRANSRRQDPWDTENGSSSVESVSTDSRDSDQPITAMAEVMWYPLIGQSDDLAYFMSESDEEFMSADVRGALISGGFNLLNSPFFICKAFEMAKVQASLMTPCSVIEFLKSNRLLMPELPAPISSTPFNCIETLQGVISYCMRESDLIFDLEDLPFGLAQDDNLHYLSSDDQLFYSSHYDLVPECADLYLHSDLVNSSFPDISSDVLPATKVFKEFGVEEFGLYINQTLGDQFCPSSSLLVSWNPDAEGRPNKNWLFKIWSFLSMQNQHIISEYDENPMEAMDSLEMTLFALQSWCLLPVFAVPDLDSNGEPDIIVDGEAADVQSKEGSALREISKKLSMSVSLTSLTSSCGLEDREHFLVPLQHAHMVMDFSQKDGMTEAMRQALRKLKLPELNSKIVDGKTIGKPVAPAGPSGLLLTRLLCAKVADPRSVLKCLNYCVDRSKQSIGQLLHASECNLLLKYFSEAIESRQLPVSDDEVITQLRRLPFYVSLSGQQTELADYEVYILPQGIPGAEIDVWRSKAGVLFLQRNDSLGSLYSLLDCQSLTDVQVYCQFIFEHFEYLSDDARVVHLTYIRDRKLPMLSDEEREQLIGRLTTLKFIHSQSDEELHTASDYYDAENRLFQLMLGREMFPPEPFDNYRWTRFLRMVGLNSVISDEKFIEFAEAIAQESQVAMGEARLSLMSKTVAELDEKAKVLTRELFKTINLASNDELLTKMKVIPYLCATRVNSKYHDFCPQHGFKDADVKFVSFNDSLPDSRDNTQCCWTSAYFLPHWADPGQLKSTEVSYDYHEDDELSSLECYKQEIACQLGVKAIPSKEQMVRHIINISETVEEEGRKLGGDKSELLVEVMTCLYQLLQTHAMDDDYTASKLKHIPCVVIGGKTLVRANQLVLNLYEEQQIKPYLYKTPSELSNFNHLFRYLGATERAAAEQFAAVLDQLFEENQSEILHPNSLRCAYRAVKGLFTLLSKAEVAANDLETLYLPGQDACLRPADSLVYNDEPSYTDRLLNFDLPFLVDLRECKLQISYFNDIASKLPEELRPLMLSDLVEECLEESCTECHSSYGAAQVLRSRLTSTEFTAGILRLIRHDHMERAEKPNSAALKAVQRSLKSIRVHAVERLVTYLRYDGEKIQGSESDAECFITKSSDSSKAEWCLYVHTQAEITPELLVKVAEIVNKIAGGLLQNSIIYLHPILSCAAYEIPLTLDKLRVRQDHHSAKGPTLQPPGSFIPLDLHHLLKQDFVDFETEEYVGYELDDPEMYNRNGSATYIYATIMEKLPVECAKYDRNTQRFFDRYRINIGEDVLPVIVSSLDLYRLHRVIEKKKSRHVSSGSDVYNDSSFLQTDSGDYLLLSPGGQSIAAELDQGIIVEEDEADDLEEGGVSVEAEEQKQEETSGEINENEEETEETEEPPVYSEIWEETTVYTELEVKTEDETDTAPSQKSKPVSQPEVKVKSAGAADVPQFDYPEISEKNVEQIKKILNKQVRAIWKLPEEQRKKVIKRLMLKFHPDKNPDKVELCTQLTQNIREIIEDIEDGGFVADKENRSDWWSEFINRRAKAYGEQKNDFEDKLKETYAQYASTLGPEYANPQKGYDSASSKKNFEKFKNAVRRNPVPEEARRWLRQANADLKSAYNDYQVEEPSYEWVLLKVHQAAEKALKAGCYTLDSKKVNLMDLKLISSSLRDKEVSEYAQRIQELIGPCDQLTHPSNIHFPQIPHELVSVHSASQALELCEGLLRKIANDFMEVMERELRGETTSEESNRVDNTLALVPVPKRRARRRVDFSPQTESQPTIALSHESPDFNANGGSAVIYSTNGVEADDAVDQSAAELVMHEPVFARNGSIIQPELHIAEGTPIVAPNGLEGTTPLKT